MRVEHLLDLARIDVVAVADDHVLEPVDEEQVAVVVDVAEVAGREPAVAETGASSAPRRAQYPGITLEPRNWISPTSPAGQRRRRRDDAQLGVAERAADRARLPRLALPVGRRDAGDLREPVALVDVGAERLLEVAGHLDRERGAADVREPERRQRGRRDASGAAERDAHRRDAEQHRRAGRGHESRASRPGSKRGTTATAPPVASVATRPGRLAEDVRERRGAEHDVGGAEGERLGRVRRGGARCCRG